MTRFARVAATVAVASLTLAAAVSVRAAVNNAVYLGQDLQWSPARMFVEGINPYAQYLAGDPGELFVALQFPPYAHGLYVLFVPLGLMPFADARLLWMGVNLALAAWLPWWMARRCGFAPPMAYVITLLFLCSTPFRTTVANGQMGLVAVATMTLALFSNRSWAYLAAGVGCLKYSFALPFASWLWHSRGAGALAWALAPETLGFLIFLWWVGGSPTEVFWQPVQVGSIATYDGQADLMSALARVVGRHSPLRWDITIPVGVSLIAAWAIHRRVRDPITAYALLLLTSLLTFRHLIYDWVALLPALLWTSSAWPRLHRSVALLVIGYFWYGIRVLQWLGETSDWWMPEAAENALHPLLGWALWAAIWHRTLLDVDRPRIDASAS